MGRSQDVAIATTSRDQATGQVQQQQQQATGAATGTKLSHTELNVLQTMIVVIACFIVCWSPGSFSIVIQLLTVRLVTFKKNKIRYILLSTNFVVIVFTLRAI